MSLVGTYNLQIQAKSDDGTINDDKYYFKLLLLVYEGSKKPNTAPYIPDLVGGDLLSTDLPNTGADFNYVMPKITDDQGDNIKISVFLGDAEAFICYDAKTTTFRSCVPNAPIPIGDYRIVISVSDDNAKGKRATEFYMNVRVFDNRDKPGEEDLKLTIGPFRTAEKYLMPNIASVTTLGLLTLQWDHDVVKPTNVTWFVEQLRREVVTEDL